jgi:hypothetical protein
MEPRNYEEATANQAQCNEAKSVSSEYDIENLFTYHPPSRRQQEQYEAIRTAAKLMAHVIVVSVPNGADKSAAIRKLREAVMTANAAIATSGY